MDMIKGLVLLMWRLATGMAATVFSLLGSAGGWLQFGKELVSAVMTTTGRLLRSPLMVKMAVLGMVAGWSVGVFVVAHKMGQRPVKALKETVEIQAESIVDLNRTIMGLNGKIAEMAAAKQVVDPVPSRPEAAPAKKKAQVRRRVSSGRKAPPASSVASSSSFPF